MEDDINWIMKKQGNWNHKFIEITVNLTGEAAKKKNAVERELLKTGLPSCFWLNPSAINEIKYGKIERWNKYQAGPILWISEYYKEMSCHFQDTKNWFLHG